MRRSCAALAVFPVLGCSPEFDGCEVQPTEGGFAAVLPSRPNHETRALSGTPEATIMYLGRPKPAKSVFAVTMTAICAKTQA